MDQLGIDAIVASTREHVTYVASYRSFSQWLIPAAHAFAILPRARELPVTVVLPYAELDVLAHDGAAVGRVMPFGSFFVARADGAPLDDAETRMVALRDLPRHPDPVTALAGALAELGLRGARLALDERGIRPALRDEIRTALGPAPPSDGFAPLQAIRMVKSSEEIRRLEASAKAAEGGILAVVAAFREGVSEADLLRVYESEILAQGCRPTFAHILFGRRGALSNGHPSEATALKRGDLVRFDVGCRYADYTSDISRQASFGEPDRRGRAAYDAIQAGEDAALELVRPGATADALFRAAVAATRDHGLPHYDRHHTGHGIGIELYDPPMIAPGVETTLEEGMVLNVETPYYELGWGGVQVEDTIVVTANGYRPMLTTPRQLIVG
jgi:Xaa-Pro aminopeptidase